nr:MAG TPA: hypothetical protein [Caudoviricetes sp.]DAX56975.1 MAG TPA: hypothetical protein [Caudoviricetes sp.]
MENNFIGALTLLSHSSSYFHMRTDYIFSRICRAHHFHLRGFHPLT